MHARADVVAHKAPSRPRLRLSALHSAASRRPAVRAPDPYALRGLGRRSHAFAQPSPPSAKPDPPSHIERTATPNLAPATCFMLYLHTRVLYCLLDCLILKFPSSWFGRTVALHSLASSTAAHRRFDHTRPSPLSWPPRNAHCPSDS
jgi:hypothetical protein